MIHITTKYKKIHIHISLYDLATKVNDHQDRCSINNLLIPSLRSSNLVFKDHKHIAMEDITISLLRGNTYPMFLVQNGSKSTLNEYKYLCKSIG